MGYDFDAKLAAGVGLATGVFVCEGVIVADGVALTPCAGNGHCCVTERVAARGICDRSPCQAFAGANSHGKHLGGGVHGGAV